MKRNILLLFVLIVSTSLLSIPVGNLMSKYIFSSGSWVLSDSVGDFIEGFPFIYLFLSSFLYGLMGKSKKWIWSIVSILPILFFLFYIESGKLIWFWSVAFFIAGGALSFILQKLFKRNSPAIQ